MVKIGEIVMFKDPITLQSGLGAVLNKGVDTIVIESARNRWLMCKARVVGIGAMSHAVKRMHELKQKYNILGAFDQIVNLN